MPTLVPKNGDGKCDAGNNFEHTVKYEEHTMVPMFYCIITSKENAMNQSDVIGSCLFSYIGHLDMYYPPPCNITKLNKHT